MAAAFNRIHEAKAARLPDDLADDRRERHLERAVRAEGSRQPVWNFGGSLLMPIFRGGALKTQVEIRTAEQKQAIAAYADVGPARVR